MSKAEIRTILRDIQAAARIGHTEAIWTALEGLGSLPEVIGNHPMTEPFLHKVVLPVGAALAHSHLQTPGYKPLTTHSHAVYRAVGGAALMIQYLEGQNSVRLETLTTLAQDPRKDVRQALLLSAVQSGETHPERFAALCETWLMTRSPRAQELGWQYLPYLPEDVLFGKLTVLDPASLAERFEVKKAVSETIKQLGRSSLASEILEILHQWAQHPEPEVGIITRALSSSWAASHPARALEILTEVARRTGPKNRIRKALESLSEHGAGDLVRETVTNWRSSEDPRLRAAGLDEHLKR